MARKDTGNKLDFLTLQPGSEFTSTPVGFDTGSRMVICDSRFADTLQPSEGTSDADITYLFGSGAKRRGEHRWMFVTACQRIAQSAGITTMRISLAGQILKPGQSIPLHMKSKDYGTGVETKQIEVGDAVIEVGLQVVTVTFLWLNLQTLAPINASVGLPEYIADKGPLIDANTGITLPSPTVDYFRLTGRSSIGIGGDPRKNIIPGVGVASHISLSNTRRLFQVTDTVTRTVIF